MARILPIAIVGVALVLYALWRGAYPDLFDETEPPAEAAAPATSAPSAPEASAGAPAPAPDKPPVKPELDVVRIDKDGDTVIAGKAAPGASVKVATQDETLAVVKADDRGQWVALPDKPLPAGDHAVTIEVTGEDGKVEVGDKTIVVSIPEDGKDEKPLVIAVPTGDFGATEVLQRPEPAPGSEEPAGIGGAPPAGEDAAQPPAAVAAAPAAPTPAGTPEQTGPDAAADAGDALPAADAPAAAGKDAAQPPAAVAATPAAPTETGTPEQTGPDATADAGDALPPAGAPAAAGEDAAQPPAAVAAAPAAPTPAGTPEQPGPTAAADAEDASPPADAPARGKDAAQPPPAVAEASGRARPPAPPDAGTPPSAARPTASEEAAPASGQSGEPARQAATSEQSDPAPAADSPPAAGGTSTVRKSAAGTEPPARKPAARLPVTAGTVPDEPQPAEERPAAVARAPDAPAPPGAKAGTPPPAAATAPPAPPPTPKDGQTASPSGAVSVDAVDYDDRSNLALAGTAKPGSVVEPKIAAPDSDGQSLGEVRADEKGVWRLEVERPVAPGRYALTVEERSPEGALRSRIRLPFQRAAPITDFPAGRLVVVQPGNSLWRIARRLYGQGVRYTVIYAANQTQIGNPDLIFPGQVFAVPQAH